MTPAEMRQRGRQLIQAARQKEREVQQRQLVALGEIFQMEIKAGWATPWPALQAELEGLLGGKISAPSWGQEETADGKK